MHRKITRRNISLVRYSIVILILTWIRYFKKKILAGTRIRWFNTQHWAATEIAQWRQTIRLCIIPGILDSFNFNKNNNVNVWTRESMTTFTWSLLSTIKGHHKEYSKKYPYEISFKIKTLFKLLQTLIPIGIANEILTFS